MNQLSSITPLEIILIGSAAVGVFLFFRACWRNIKRSRQHLSVALLTLMMVLTAQTAWAADITQNTAVVINSGNKATYHNKSIAGTVPADSYAGNNGFFISKGAVVVDGIELNLTIDGFNVDYTVRATPVSGISLVNGATLHLTIKGENTLTAGFGGAGIAVPDGCTLEITAASDGTLHATGGKNYGGGAGIGSIGDRNNTNQGSNFLFPQGLGTITINGGIIYAKGGTWYNINKAAGGAAGIGSSELSGATTTDSSWGGTTYINNITGSITINGGTVTATGGQGAAGIGGGNNGTLQTITITGGTVTATPGKGAAAIGIGFNGFTSGSGTLTIPAVSITGGTVKANGSIGFGEAIDDSQTLGASGSPIYHITYELNGGKNAAANPEWYEQGVGVFSLADPTYKTGFDFAGWYDNADLVGTPITSIAAGTTGAMTLYAKWTRHKYTITYYPNEGTMPSHYPTNYYLGVLTFALPTPTRDGYNFRGWYTNEDFASAKYTQIDQGTYGDFDFYAKWEKWGENDEGSKWNPYKIRTEADLRDLATKVNGGDKCAGVYYQQMGDITITGGDWTPIGTKDNYFAGIFDGGNYTISGISISSESGYQGLFGKVTGTLNQRMGFIQNIVLENSTIAGGNYTGGIVGYLNNGHVLNCHVRSDVTVQASVDGTSSSTKKYFGGVVGYFHNGTVTDCTSMATVDNGGHSYVQYLGGVIGYMMQFQENNTATATNCFSYGMDAIGGRGREIAGGTATNAERVYSLRCSDGSITLPEDVPATDGFLYNGVRYYKGGAVVPFTVNLKEEPGFTVTVSYKPGSSAEVIISPDDFGDYYFTVPAENKSFTVKATKTQNMAKLTDDKDLSALTAYAGKTCTVAFSREFTEGKASTVCLPFAYVKKKGDGGFYEFTDITKNDKGEYVATMTDPGVTTLTPNQPYLYMPNATGAVDFGGTYEIPASLTAGSTTSGEWTFCGTYQVLKYGTAPMQGPVYGFASTDKEVNGVKVSAGEFVKAKEGAGVKPMRCYLIYGNASAGTRAADDLPQSITVRFLSSTGDTTGIGTLDTESGEIDFGGWYTLSGRKLAAKPTQKGLYIHNGKKIIIK